MKLIYVADPMCSWCYGFGKEMTAFTAAHPELALEIVVGGVRAGATDLLDDAGKQFRLGHWARVEENSGLPFNRDAFKGLKNFVYDTEPVCRAVVAARELAPQADLLAVFRALQHGFYADGRDTTDGLVLSEIAVAALAKQGVAVTVPEFYENWKSAATIGATQADFGRARAMGVRSFPALLLQTGGRLIELSPGYTHAAELEARFKTILPKLAA